jgi:hypothetical protein
MAAIEELGNPLTSSKHFDQPSGVVSVQIVYGGGDSNIITLLGGNGVPNKTYIELTQAQNTERNVINQASASATLDSFFLKIQNFIGPSGDKLFSPKKITPRVLTAEEAVVETARQNAQSANDLAANKQRLALGKKSKLILNAIWDTG